MIIMIFDIITLLKMMELSIIKKTIEKMIANEVKNVISFVEFLEEVSNMEDIEDDE